MACPTIPNAELLLFDRAERQQQLRAQQPAIIQDPPALNPRGRPRTTRLHAAREGVRIRTRLQSRLAAADGPALNGSAQAEQPPNQVTSGPAPRRCGKCQGVGHDRRRCPN